VGSQKERDHWEDLDVDGRIILRCVLEILWGGMDGLIWLRIGTGGAVL
jgi:hypothetical protein